MRRTRTPLLLMCALLASLAVPPQASAAAQDDARTGSDAPDTFAAAAQIAPTGPYTGRLDPAAGDKHDYLAFHLGEGASVSVLVEFSAYANEPVTLFDPAGAPVDAGTALFLPGTSASGAIAGDVFTLRLAVHRAHVAGFYRLHLRAEHLGPTAYRLCFVNCEEPRQDPIEFIFGGSLRRTHTRVLLVPPSHGDLGNPSGPSVADYIDATLRGLRSWLPALDAFARDYPQFAYLRELTVHIEVFDGVSPVEPAGYDVVVGYVAAGAAFRGVATTYDSGRSQRFLDSIGVGGSLRSGGRAIALSLFGGSPRAGQVLYDYPEVNDLENVTMHEFGHTFGLGHTLTWHPVSGPDLMNSPATFVYGDGFAGGDGGERTALDCLSSLNLYGMAVLYRWVPSKAWEPTGGTVDLPDGIPYSLYC